MKFGAGRRTGARSGSRVLLVSISVALLWQAAVEAQLVTPLETPAEEAPPIHDYYAQYTDPSTATLLRTVEYHHLAGSFWQYYREGLFHSANADLDYLLARFPNHPKALHLIAYDKSLKREPSAVIQKFEFAIRSFPDHAYTYAQYGRYLASIGRRNTAIQLLDRALQLDPHLVVARGWLEEEMGSVSRTAPEPPPGGAGAGRHSPASTSPPTRRR